MNIQLNGVNGQCEGVAKCDERVFWGKSGASTMGNSLNMTAHRGFFSHKITKNK
jgi:hypothetical protein